MTSEQLDQIEARALAIVEPIKPRHDDDDESVRDFLAHCNQYHDDVKAHEAAINAYGPVARADVLDLVAEVRGLRASQARHVCSVRPNFDDRHYRD